jgi:hypothetical protein
MRKRGSRGTRSLLRGWTSVIAMECILSLTRAQQMQ